MPQPTNNKRQISYLDKGLDFIKQFVISLLMHRTAFAFIRDHKPWQGMERLGWVVWLMAGAGALLSYQYFRDFYQVVEEMRNSPQPISASLVNIISLEKFQWALDGGRKYLVLIVLELVVFYFIQKTLEFRIGRKPELTTKAFVGAEIRIFKVTLLAWILETIARFFIVNLAIGILGFHLLEKPVGFLIQCYFLGFTLVDNYHECFDLKVADSEHRTRRMAIGVAVATGLVAQLLMYIPGIGAVIATMLGAVAATLAMERLAPVNEEEHLSIIAEQQKKVNKKYRENQPMGG